MRGRERGMVATRETRRKRGRPATAEASLAAASPRFGDVHAGTEKTVRALFAGAKPKFLRDLPGWRVALPAALVPLQWRRTMPRNRVTILPAEGKSAVTLLFWNPLEYAFLERHAGALPAAGFQAMRGCVPFTRKGPWPAAAVGALLLDVAVGLRRLHLGPHAWAPHRHWVGPQEGFSRRRPPTEGSRRRTPAEPAAPRAGDPRPHPAVGRWGDASGARRPPALWTRRARRTA